MIRDALASYLLNAAWQAPIVALCALIVTRFGGLSPRAVNRLWLGFLAAAVILPAVALGDILPRALPVVARIAPTAPLTLAQTASALGHKPSPAVPPDLSLQPWAAWLMVGVFALAAAAIATRLMAACLAARRLVAQSRPVILPAEVARALDKLARDNRRPVPPVRRSHAVHSPAVVGALKPVILIPHDLAAADDDLRAALLHELAHVLRHDYAVNLACEIFTLPVAWHPATLALKAGVRHSRELACDAMAAAAMTSQKTYARCLVSLAQSLGAGPAHPPMQASLAVGLFGRGDLEDRLMKLMQPRDAEAPALRAARLCGLAALGAGLLGSAALLHVSPVFAQASAPPARPADVAEPAAATAAAPGQTVTDPARPTAGRRHGVIYSKNGVTYEIGQTGHRHSFTAANGEAITVVNDDPAEPTAEQQRAWEAEARDAEAKAAAAEAMVNAPAFKARIASARASAARAEAMVNSPAFKAGMAKIKTDAEAAGKLIDSPEFRARIAAARASGEAARVSGEAARTMVDSPEFRAQMARIREDAAEMRRDMAAWRAQDRERGAPSPTP